MKYARMQNIINQTNDLSSGHNGKAPAKSMEGKIVDTNFLSDFDQGTMKSSLIHFTSIGARRITIERSQYPFITISHQQNSPRSTRSESYHKGSAIMAPTRSRRVMQEYSSLLLAQRNAKDVVTGYQGRINRHTRPERVVCIDVLRTAIV